MSSVLARESGEPDAEQYRILHVDDEPDFANLAAEFLEREGDRLEVVTEASADDALDRLAADRVDCIVSDYDMPDTSGLEFLEAVRENDEEIPFILFTGLGSEEVASDAISAGVTDYLQKGDGTDQYAVLANRIENAVEQYRARTAAERSQRRLRELAENTPDVRWMVSGDWSELLFINSAYEEMFGQPIDRLESDVAAFLDAVHPEDRPDVRSAMERTSDDEAVELEFRVNPVENYRRWVWVGCEPIRDQDGNVARIVGFSRDITERKERTRELEQYEQLVETVGDGIYVLDDDLAFSMVNETMTTLTGYSREELLGTELAALVDDGTTIVGTEAREELLVSDRATNTVRAEVRAADGERVPCEFRFAELSTDAGVSTVGVVRDVSERKAQESELRKTNRQLQTIIDTVTAVVFVKDREGRYQLVNDTFREVLDFDEGEVIGRTDYELFSAADAETFRSDDQHVLQSCETIRREETVPTSEGERTFLTLKSPMLDEAGNPTGICAVSTDISERAEDKRELEKRNDRLDEFVSVVSHDLRGPLSTLVGSLSLAEETGGAEHFERCHRAVDRMEQLIENLLTLARNGKDADDLQPVALKTAAEACWATVETQLATLTVESDLTIMAAESRFKQLLENLIRNSVEHGSANGRDGAGQAAVSLRVGSFERGVDRGFYVADDGPGIPAEARERVFDADFSTRSEGRGLGLAIVDQVAGAHDWDVRVTESDAGGARFEITGVETPSDG